MDGAGAFGQGFGGEIGCGDEDSRCSGTECVRGGLRGIGRGGADADEKWDVFRGCGQCRCSGGVFDGEEVCAGVECAADLDGAGSPAIDEHRDAETVARGFQALDVSQALYGERWGFGDVEEPSADTGCVGADRVLGQVVDGTAEWSRRECVVGYVGNIGLNDKGGADGEVERLEMGGEAEGKVEGKVEGFDAREVKLTNACRQVGCGGAFDPDWRKRNTDAAAGWCPEKPAESV